MSGLYTRAILIADTRITLRDPSGRLPDREFDGVQKIHAVHGNMALGFAGNIDTGFKMVGDLATMARNSIPPDHLTNEPSRLLFKWARRARHAWHNLLTPRERAGGCALMFAAARPPLAPLHFLTPNMLYTLRAPEFEPVRVASGIAASIGSGAGVADYAAEVQMMSDEFNNLLGFENEAWEPMGGPLIVLSAFLADRIRKVAAPSVSPHLVLCSVRWGDVLFATNEGVGFEEEHRAEAWPPVARSWREWRQLKRQNHLADLVAVT